MSTDMSHAGPPAHEAEKARARLLNLVDEGRNPRTKATVNQLMEAARILRVDPATLYRAIRDDAFPPVRVRTRYVVPAAALHRLVRQAAESGGCIDVAPGSPPSDEQRARSSSFAEVRRDIPRSAGYAITGPASTQTAPRIFPRPGGHLPASNPRRAGSPQHRE